MTEGCVIVVSKSSDMARNFFLRNRAVRKTQKLFRTRYVFSVKLKRDNFFPEF